MESKRGYRARKKKNENRDTCSEVEFIERDSTRDETSDRMRESVYQSQRDSARHSRKDNCGASGSSSIEASPPPHNFISATIKADSKAYAHATSASSGESLPRKICFDQFEKRALASQEPADLIDVFYKTFFAPHGFMVPRKLLLQSPGIIPEELKAVMRYVGSHYQPTYSQEALRNAALKIRAKEVTVDPGFQVQGLLCLAIVFMAGREESALGMQLLAEAIDLALSIGLYRQQYSANRLHDHPILAESWRRTWWDLFVVDILLSTFDASSYRSRLRQVKADVSLPGHADDYVNCIWKPPAPNLSEMRDRLFAETTYNYSSGAYKIEAARILGTVLSLEADTFNVTNTQVETIDASIQAFVLSLPPDFREVVEIDNKVDEVLFAA